MEVFIEFFNKIPTMITEVLIKPSGIITAVIIAMALLLVFNVLSKNNALKLSFGYLVYIIVSGAICLILKATAIQYLILLVVVSVFMLLLFATEIKRDIWNTKSVKKLSGAEI
ncbi:MAG: hypothetical protein J6R88_00310 [Clostridia bacterium]|nr:hypothetical protein [Clostridia bacterium]